MLAFAVILLCASLLSVNGRVQQIFEPPQLRHEFSDIDFNRTKMFSAMSPYHLHEECTPVKVWLHSRHSSKWPAEEILSKIKDQLIPDIQEEVKKTYNITNNAEKLNYDDRLQKNQKKIIQSIIKWENNLDQASHKDLNERGKETMVEFGERLHKKLSPWVKTLTKHNIEAYSATEWRCVLSGKKFFSAFFEEDHDDIDIKTDEKDRRLELIKPSIDEVGVIDPENPKGKKIAIEKLFLRINCQDTIWRIKKILFPDYVNGYVEKREKITEDMVLTMYHVCAHSYYFFDDSGKKLDVWCWLFSFDDLKMFEDMQDLQYYYKNGYFRENNTKIGNPMTNDLLHFLEDPTITSFKAFFGHTSNCLSLITRFNMYRDNKILTLTNIVGESNRKWRTSLIAPFGCNMMVIVYDCNYALFRATIFVNEAPIKLELDNGKTCVKCPLKEVIDLIKNFNTDELLTPSTTEEEDRVKIIEKEKKAKEKKKQKEEKLQKEIKEKLRLRLEDVFDEKEEYWDEGERERLEAASTSGVL